MRIGILGDGQLALLLGEALEQIDAESGRVLTQSCFAFGKDPHSSFASRFSNHVHYSSPVELLTALKKIRPEVLVLENEFFTAAELEELERETGARTFPDPRAFRAFETKANQRTLFSQLGIPSPAWRVIARADDATDFTFPAVVKTLARGYDGYGVRFVERAADLSTAIESFGRPEETHFLLEEKIALRREFAAGVLLDGEGGALYLPLVETVQVGATCGAVYSRWSADAAEAARIEGAIRAALVKFTTLGWRGLFHFEFLERADGAIFINEGAPRPHNSAHLTINACPKSQFRVLLELAAGLRLPEIFPAPELPAENAVMLNLLGRSSGRDYEKDFKFPEVNPPLQLTKKFYGKTESRPGRKLGHAVIVDPSGHVDLRGYAVD